MPEPTPTPAAAPPATALDLRSVASEVLFAAQFSEAVLDGTPSAADKTRLRALLLQIRNDLETVTDRLASHLGVDPLFDT